MRDIGQVKRKFNDNFASERKKQKLRDELNALKEQQNPTQSQCHDNVRYAKRIKELRTETKRSSRKGCKGRRIEEEHMIMPEAISPFIDSNSDQKSQRNQLTNALFTMQKAEATFQKADARYGVQQANTIQEAVEPQPADLHTD